MDSYKYDIFLSYRRHGEWPTWVRQVFRPLFDHWLAEELGRHPEIYVDYEIPEGDSWPENLAHALSQSRVLVPLWTPTYFNSKWCLAELACMYARESLFGFRTKKQPAGLIVPATLHDGDRFPKEARRIQQARLQECANVRIARNSPTEEELSKRLREWVPKVASAIDHAPAFDPEWLDLDVDNIVRLFQTGQPRQKELPSLG